MIQVFLHIVHHSAVFVYMEWCCFFLDGETGKMLGMPTLGVGISRPRNRGASFQPEKIPQPHRVSPEKGHLFFTFSPSNCKTHQKLLCQGILGGFLKLLK